MPLTAPCFLSETKYRILAGCGVLALAWSGCAAPAPAPLPVPPAALVQFRATSASIRITIPKRIRHGRTRDGKPAYISPATHSIDLDFIPSRGGKRLDVGADLTPASPGCTSSSGSTVCTIRAALTPGTYEANVVTYSGLHESGAVLSEGQQEPVEVVKGKANSIALTVYGVPNALILMQDAASVSGSQASGFTIFGNMARFAIAARDAAGNAIVGPGSPTYAVTSSNPAFTLKPPTQQNMDFFSIAPPNEATSTATTVKVSAQFADPTVCQQPAAVCSVSADVNATPYSADDWTTYAHDVRRTGNQTQSTGISLYNVSSLQVAWTSQQLDSSVIAAPAVYGGMVFVATSGGTVYALNAVTGALVWKTVLPMTLPAGANAGTVKSSPVIDGHELFIGDIYYNTSHPSGWLDHPEFPSDYFGLDLATGAILWKTQLLGIVRSQPVAIDGRVYVGTSGGDPLNCLQGGMQALDESTGSILWTWVVSPVAGNGGSSWSAVTYDGSHIVFGTGNTCTVNEVTSDAVVALNLDGTLAWVFQPQANVETDAEDNDQGGGISYANGNYYFENKNGSIYGLSGFGLLQFTSSVGGRASIATPTTDGTTILADEGHATSPQDRVAASHPITEMFLDVSNKSKPRFVANDGTTPAETAGSGGLVAFSMSGTARWIVPSTGPVYEYAAINNGVAFAAINGAMSAYSVSSGTWAGWTFAGTGSNDNFLAGPVVVPSGVYAADTKGYVYAFRLPGANAKARPR